MSIFAIANPVFRPTMRVISSITNANAAVVLTAVDDFAGVLVPATHGYLVGTIVRLNIPEGFGMTRINQQTGTITRVTPTSFTVDIDTTNLDPFVIPTVWPYNQQKSTVVPIGQINSMLTAATINVL